MQQAGQIASWMLEMMLWYNFTGICNCFYLCVGSEKSIREGLTGKSADQPFQGGTAVALQIVHQSPDQCFGMLVELLNQFLGSFLAEDVVPVVGSFHIQGIVVDEVREVLVVMDGNEVQILKIQAVADRVVHPFPGTAQVGQYGQQLIG